MSAFVTREGMFDLSGRVAVVTGGGRGIGRAIAQGLATFGARVALCGRTAATLAQTEAEILAAGGDAAVQVTDMAKEADVIVLRDPVLARFGGIDVLVNNAGVNPIWRTIEETGLSDWHGVIDVNLTGLFLCCKYLGGAMAERGAGSIINVSSVGGHVGLIRSAPYCAAKGGAESLTKALALDWAKSGVRVNCLAPMRGEAVGASSRPSSPPPSPRTAPRRPPPNGARSPISSGPSCARSPTSWTRPRPTCSPT